jgi:hypothetical protein
MKDASLEEVVVMCRAKARGEAMPRWMVTEVQSQLKEVQDKLRETVTVLKAQQAEQNNRNNQHQALLGIMAEQMMERAERRREEVRERRQEQEERREEEARERRQERTTTRTRRKTRRGETIWGTFLPFNETESSAMATITKKDGGTNDGKSRDAPGRSTRKTTLTKRKTRRRSTRKTTRTTITRGKTRRGETISGTFLETESSGMATTTKKDGGTNDGKSRDAPGRSTRKSGNQTKGTTGTRRTIGNQTAEKTATRRIKTRRGETISGIFFPFHATESLGMATTRHW